MSSKRPGMLRGERREEGSGWGTHVYLWWIHFDIWQNQYNTVKLKKKKEDLGKRILKVYLHPKSTRLPSLPSETLIFEKTVDTTSRAYLFGGGGEKNGKRESLFMTL